MYLQHVSHDDSLVFAHTRERITKILQVSCQLPVSSDANLLGNGLQEYDGQINFGTDTWTLPNHY
jgi:hypothetical protein